MKRNLLTILTLICAVACAFGAVACVDPNGDDAAKYIITVNCGANGSYTLSEQSPVEENTSVTLTVKPNSGYDVDEVKVNDSKVGLTDNKYTFTVTQDTTITISFKATTTPNEPQVKKYNVSVNCGEGGSYELSNPSPVPENTNVTLTVKPNSGYEVGEVKVNDSNVELIDNKYTFAVIKNTVIAISFNATEPQEKKYNVSVTKGEHGDYEITQEGEVDENTEVTFTAKPEAGYEVNAFIVNGEEKELTDNAYTFSVTEDTEIDITFKEQGAAKQYSVKVACGENGSYNINAEGMVAKDYVLTLTVIPDIGYEVDEVKKNDKVVPPKDDDLYKNVFEMVVSGNTIITITFKEDAFGPHEHHFESKNWFIHTKPTDTYPGLARNFCSICHAMIEIGLPEITSEAYVVTRNTATCTTPGIATVTITIEKGDSGEILSEPAVFTFENVNYPALGHLLDKDRNCTRPGCGAKDVGIFDERLIGNWSTGLASFVIEKNTIIYNGNEVTDLQVENLSGQIEISFKVDNYKYTLVATPRETHKGSYYVIVGNYRVIYGEQMTSPDMSLGEFFRDDYPIQFSADLIGTWKSSKSTNNITISKRSVKYGGDYVFMNGFNEDENSVVFTWNISDEMSGGNFTATYSKSNKTIVLKAVMDDGTENEYTYTKNGESGYYGEKVDPKYAGTYKSEDGKYTLVISDEGIISFNGVRVNLEKEPNGYSFLYGGARYQFNIPLLLSGTVTFNCPGLGIEKTYLYLVEQE